MNIVTPYQLIKLQQVVIDNPKNSKKYKNYARFKIGQVILDYGLEDPRHPSEADRIAELGNQRG